MTASACGWQRGACTRAASCGLGDVTLEHMPLTQPQLRALVLGLPWQRVEDDGAIRLL